MKNHSNSLFSAFIPLLPFMAVVLACILATGMTLPVIPRHVHEALGQGTTMVGVVMGSQFISAFLGRMRAGHVADAHGPRRSVLVGLLATGSTGIVYLVLGCGEVDALTRVSSPKVHASLARNPAGGPEIYFASNKPVDGSGTTGRLSTPNGSGAKLFIFVGQFRRNPTHSGAGHAST